MLRNDRAAKETENKHVVEAPARQKALTSAAAPGAAHTAIVVIHGMGQQVQFETIDTIVHWAPLTEGLVGVVDVVHFLIDAGTRGLIEARTSFRRWMFDHSVELKTGLGTRVLLLISLLVIGALAAGSADAPLRQIHRQPHRSLAFARPADGHDRRDSAAIRAVTSTHLTESGRPARSDRASRAIACGRDGRSPTRRTAR